MDTLTLRQWWSKQKLPQQDEAILGFKRNAHGSIRPIRGKNLFYTMPLEYRSCTPRYVKQTSLVGAQAIAVSNQQYRPSPYEDLLPLDLVSLFRSGMTVTSRNGNSENVSGQEGPKALPFRLHFVHGFHSLREGRTAVLCKDQDEPAPIIITINGLEYVIELKGVGMAAGGYGAQHFRNGHLTLYGSAELEQVENETQQLLSNSTPGGCRFGGAITFSYENKDYGMIIRLTPSTIRASYTCNSTFPDISLEKYSRRIISMAIKSFAWHLTRDNPVILDRSYHIENLLLFGENKFEYSDFCGHISLSSHLYPRYDDGLVNISALLQGALFAFFHLPGPSKQFVRSHVQKAIVEEFREKGIRIDRRSSKGIQDQIASSFLLERVFRERAKAHHRYEGLARTILTAPKWAIRPRVSRGLEEEKLILARLIRLKTVSEDVRRGASRGLAVIQNFEKAYANVNTKMLLRKLRTLSVYTLPGV